jgi:hypothetical protein
LGYLKASVDFALRHQEVGKEFAEYLKTRLWNKKSSSEIKKAEIFLCLLL